MTESKDLQKTVETVIGNLQAITVQDQDSLNEANRLLTACKQTVKLVEDYYSGDLQAAMDEKRAADAKRKAVVEQIDAFKTPLSKAERLVKNQMSAYLTEQERVRREEERKRRAEEEDRRLAAAIDTGREEVLDKPIAIVKEEAPELSKGTYTVDVWEYEIVDIAKINPEFLIPDTSAIGKTVRTMKERAASMVGEGVKVICRKDIRSRV